MGFLVIIMIFVDIVYKVFEIDFVNSLLYYIKFMIDVYLNV